MMYGHVGFLQLVFYISFPMGEGRNGRVKGTLGFYSWHLYHLPEGRRS